MKNTVLRSLRHNKGLTIREAAEQIGTTEPTLIAAENGSSTPNISTKFKIATFYDGTPVTDIWPVTDDEQTAA